MSKTGLNKSANIQGSKDVHEKITAQLLHALEIELIKVL